MALPPIHRAARDGNLEEVLRLIHQDPQLVHSIDIVRWTPLYHACFKGHVSVVAALVDHGANIDHQGHYGSTALYLACHEGHTPVVELLIEKGANPILAHTTGRTPLMVASDSGHVDVVRFLLHDQAIVSTIDYHDAMRKTALHFACTDGHQEVVKMLLEARADPMGGTIADRTAMDIAIERHHQDCVMLLKEWDRRYTITKARRLHDAFYRHRQAIAIATAASSSSSGGGHANHKQSQVEPRVPTYLKGRVEGGQPLPKVEMVDGYEEGSLVESVLEYVICGGLKGELFVELMEMLGKTGYREEETS